MATRGVRNLIEERASRDLQATIAAQTSAAQACSRFIGAIVGKAEGMSKEQLEVYFQTLAALAPKTIKEARETLKERNGGGAPTGA